MSEFIRDRVGGGGNNLRGGSAPHTISSISGGGSKSVSAPFGYLHLTGKAGEVKYVEARGFLDAFSSKSYFTFIQGTSGCICDFTLAPDHKVTPLWSNPLTVDETIQKIVLAYTAIRVTFTTDGSVFLAAL